MRYEKAITEINTNIDKLELRLRRLEYRIYFLNGIISASAFFLSKVFN